MRPADPAIGHHPMLDHLKTERPASGGPQGRLMAYMAGLLVLGALIVLIAQCSHIPSGDESDDDGVVRTGAFPAPPTIDLSRLSADEGTAGSARWNREGLEYLLPLAESDYAPIARRLTLEDLDALPYAEARGGVWEVTGTVEEIGREEWGTGRLWSVLLEDGSGHRAIVLKYGLASDPREGRPEDASRDGTEYLAAGDRVIARGIYLQQRSGTLGEAILREPVPVLVAAPPPAAFRKLPPREVMILDRDEVDWLDVKDQFLKDTLVWGEPALFQMIQWARRTGHDEIVEQIHTGSLEVTTWDRDLFDRWGAEVEITDPTVERPVTESLRGRLFATTGLIGSFQREGWPIVPRVASVWGIDTLYLLDLVSDHWAHQAMRCFSAFPLEAYEGVTGSPRQQVQIYGFFLKNHTYKTRKVRSGRPADVTMPMFIVVHAEPLPLPPSPYRTLIWIISGVIIVLAFVFWFVFVRGERIEADRMDAHRRALRRRRRDHAAAQEDGAPDGAPDGDAGADDVSDDRADA